jgi:hypothetical protein
MLDAILGKGWDTVFTDAVDPEATVFGFHINLKFVQPLHILAEHLGDVIDGEDV